MTEELVNAQALASAPPSQESATAQGDAILAEAQKTIALLKTELEKCQSKLVTIQTGRKSRVPRFDFIAAIIS